MARDVASYPARLSIDYPDRDLDRVTTFFRPFVAIPSVIVLALLGGSTLGWAPGPWSFHLPAAGLVVLPTVLLILFRKKYPKWWYDWNLALARFGLRVTAYLALLRDEYPSTDEEQTVHLEIPYPDAAKDLSRGLPLVKWFLAIPHFIVLSILGIAVSICVIAAWFVILFTRRFPRSLFDFIVGYLRWGVRVGAYSLLLTTDRYPPFSFDQ